MTSFAADHAACAEVLRRSGSSFALPIRLLPEAKRRGLPPVQLYDLEADPAETQNLQAEHPEIVADLIARLSAEVRRGRSTPGPDLANDREVTFLPPGFAAEPQRLGR